MKTKHITCITKANEEKEYLEVYHFRWLNIKRIDAASVILLKLYSNHPKYNSS